MNFPEALHFASQRCWFASPCLCLEGGFQAFPLAAEHSWLAGRRRQPRKQRLFTHAESISRWRLPCVYPMLISENTQVIQIIISSASTRCHAALITNHLRLLRPFSSLINVSLISSICPITEYSQPFSRFLRCSLSPLLLLRLLPRQTFPVPLVLSIFFLADPHGTQLLHSCLRLARPSFSPVRPFLPSSSCARLPLFAISIPLHSSLRPLQISQSFSCVSIPFIFPRFL